MGKGIAILYICTGEYVCLWEEFYKSFEEKFVCGMSKDYFVFTDAESVYGDVKDNVHRIYQENLGWPGNTLFRFKIFLTQKEELLKYDYVFFMNANIVCASEIGEEFLPKNERLTVVIHPGFYNTLNYFYTYDRNRKSSAYIPYGKGEVYVTGGVNGGRSIDFMELCEELDRKTDDDYKKGIIALWHDESHLNKYIWKHCVYKLLPPSYFYTEGCDIPFEKKLVARDKSRYFNVSSVKNEKKKRLGILKNYLIACAFMCRDKVKNIVNFSNCS